MSHGRFRHHNSWMRIRALTVTGAITPRGSYTLADCRRIERFVIGDVFMKAPLFWGKAIMSFVVSHRSPRMQTSLLVSLVLSFLARE